jgi:hypothetical protein
MDGLTRHEAAELRSLEATIERCRASLIEGGTAIRVIRDRRLYRETHPTFGAYCRDRWGFSDTYAYRMIEAADVSSSVEPVDGVAVTTVAQAKALIETPEEDRQEVFAEAVRRTKGSPKARDIVAAARATADDEAFSGDPRLVRAVAALRRFETVRRLLKAASSEGRSLVEDGLLPIVGPRIDAALHGLLDALNCGKPHASCPRCDGAGCDACSKRGWLAKVEYEDLQPGPRAKAVEVAP